MKTGDIISGILLVAIIVAALVSSAKGDDCPPAGSVLLPEPPQGHVYVLVPVEPVDVGAALDRMEQALGTAP